MIIGALLVVFSDCFPVFILEGGGLEDMADTTVVVMEITAVAGMKVVGTLQGPCFLAKDLCLTGKNNFPNVFLISSLEDTLMKWLAKYENHAFALLRIMAGFMFAFHGAQKILGVFSEFQPPMGSQLWFGGLIELLGGLAVMLGYQTRAAAFLCSGEMAVAYFQYHWQFQVGRNFFPAVNKGELAALYSFVFLFIATRGGVKWKLDKTN